MEKDQTPNHSRPGVSFLDRDSTPSCHHPRAFYNSRGQAIIETLVSLPVFLGGTGATFFVLYLLLTVPLIDHWAYQTSLCLARHQRVKACEDQLRKKLKPLVFHHLQNLELHQDDFEIRVHIAMTDPMGRRQVFQSLLPLPLIGKSL